MESPPPRPKAARFLLRGEIVSGRLPCSVHHLPLSRKKMKIKSSDFLQIMPVRLHMKEQTARSLCLVGLIPWLVAQVCPLLSASDLGNLGNIGFLLTAHQAGEEPGSWKLSSEAKQCGSKCLYPHVKMGFVTRPGVTPVLYSSQDA